MYAGIRDQIITSPKSPTKRQAEEEVYAEIKKLKGPAWNKAIDMLCTKMVGEESWVCTAILSVDDTGDWNPVTLDKIAEAYQQEMIKRSLTELCSTTVSSFLPSGAQFEVTADSGCSAFVEFITFGWEDILDAGEDVVEAVYSANGFCIFGTALCGSL
jgi:hypothetical protein